MKRPPYGLFAGAALVGFLLLTNAAYVALVSLFGYDDILRQPVDVVLARFQAGGPALVWAWTGFAWSALVFIAAAVLTARALEEGHGQSVWIATAAGAASGLIQAAGLLRWVFVAPNLAAAYPGAGEAERAAIAQTYNALNQYGGVALGEHLGQVLLVAWSLGIIAACWRAGGLLRWTSAIGLASMPLWIIGQTELFATVLPGLTVYEATPLAFMLWMAWLLALAIALMVQRPASQS
jgi:hypothetical protein